MPSISRALSFQERRTVKELSLKVETVNDKQISRIKNESCSHPGLFHAKTQACNSINKTPIHVV